MTRMNRFLSNGLRIEITGLQSGFMEMDFSLRSKRQDFICGVWG